MSQTFVSLDINAPVEAVFAALANIETFPYRAEAIAAVEFLSDQKHGVGTRFRETRIMNGREAVAELEVTEQVENERIRMVGTAIGQNEIGYLIPCHRVIRKTGVVGDYRWGAMRKQAIVAGEIARNSTEIGLSQQNG